MINIPIVDDGTGKMSCTIWRKNLNSEFSDENSNNDQSEESPTLGQKLIRLALRSTPVIFQTSDGKGNILFSNLAVGDSVHLRGKLRLFRESITLSANYCRKL